MTRHLLFRVEGYVVRAERHPSSATTSPGRTRFRRSSHHPDEPTRSRTTTSCIRCQAELLYLGASGWSRVDGAANSASRMPRTGVPNRHPRKAEHGIDAISRSTQ